MDWGLIIIMLLVIPFITFLPAIFLAGLVCGLYETIHDFLRERKMASKKLEKKAVEVQSI